MVHDEKGRARSVIQSLSRLTTKPSVCQFPKKMTEREPEVELCPPGDTCTPGGFGPMQPHSPAVDEIRHRVMLAEGGRIQVHADLHVVSCHDAHRSFVLILEDLPLQGGTQEQHEVIWQDREITKSPSSLLGFHDAANSPHKGGAAPSPAP